MPHAAAERPPREHREEMLVRSYEIDPDGRLRPVVLLRMLQEAAWQHASLLGKGFHHRQEGELFWVLSRLRLRMDHYPRWGERFTIRTFPVGTDRIFALREFSLHDSRGALLGRAASAWLVVDAGRGRPVRPQPVVADIEVTQSEYEGDTGRLPPLSDDHELRGPVRVRYHDIDQYRHVNNASYLEWVLDALDPDRPMGSQIYDLGMDYLKETLLSDSYTVRLQTCEETDRFEIVRVGSDGSQEAAVRGYLSWQPPGSVTNLGDFHKPDPGVHI